MLSSGLRQRTSPWTRDVGVVAQDVLGQVAAHHAGDAGDEDVHRDPRGKSCRSTRSAHHVLDRDVRLLDVLGVRAGNADGDVGQPARAPPVAGQGDHRQAAAAGRLHRGHHVARAAAGADADAARRRAAPAPRTWRAKIPSKPQSLAKAVRKEVSVVSAMAGKPGPVEVPGQAGDELGRHVLAVGGAAAVAAQEQLVAAPGRRLAISSAARAICRRCSVSAGAAPMVRAALGPAAPGTPAARVERRRGSRATAPRRSSTTWSAADRRRPRRRRRSRCAPAPWWLPPAGPARCPRRCRRSRRTAAGRRCQCSRRPASTSAGPGLRQRQPSSGRCGQM